MNNETLVQKALEAKEYAYVPFSHFKVGAAILTKNGKVYTGCNIENSSYGATNCAERTALFKAISEGEREFEKIAIVSSSNALTYPCGICRQVLAEFMPEGQIILMDEKEQIKTFKVEDLLPYRFILED